MDPKQRLALMEKIIRELDDLKNSQISVLKKIAQIEADNINLEVGLLSDGLPDLHEEVDHGLQRFQSCMNSSQNSETNMK